MPMGVSMRRVLLGLLLLVAVTGQAFADDAATCHRETGDNALAACTRAIESGQYAGADLGKLFTSRGVERKRKGDLDGAIADYTEALKINPRDLFAYNNRGNTRRDKGDLEGAVADYDAALQVDAGYAAAYTNRGRVHEVRGDVAKARADYEAALKASDAFDNSRWAKGVARDRLRALSVRS